MSRFIIRDRNVIYINRDINARDLDFKYAFYTQTNFEEISGEGINSNKFCKRCYLPISIRTMSQNFGFKLENRFLCANRALNDRDYNAPHFVNLR